MPVVVTGAAGFIGGMLTAVLATDGERVVAVDRRPVQVVHPGVTALQADLVDADPAVESALREADAVYHLAGRPGVRDAGPDTELQRHRDNVLATARVLAAVPPATPLVVASSSSVYGDCGGHPSAEDDPLRPLGGYARSKVAMELLCAQRIAAGGATAVARIFTVAGEGQRPDMALATWVEAVRRGRPIHLFGSPWRSRDITDVREVVRSLRAMAERGVVGALNVGTGAPRTLADLVSATCRAVGVPPQVTVEPASAEEPDSTCADTRRHERLLGFRPITDLDALLRRQVAASLARERDDAAEAGEAGETAGAADTPARPPTLVETAVVEEFDEPEPELPVPAGVTFLSEARPEPHERLVPFRGAASSWLSEHTATTLPRVSLPDFRDLRDDLAAAGFPDDEDLPVTDPTAASDAEGADAAGAADRRHEPAAAAAPDSSHPDGDGGSGSRDASGAPGAAVGPGTTPCAVP
jgi:nucleoside-diphosphate-sugar epimerase